MDFKIDLSTGDISVNIPREIAIGIVKTYAPPGFVVPKDFANGCDMVHCEMSGKGNIHLYPIMKKIMKHKFYCQNACRIQ